MRGTPNADAAQPVLRLSDFEAVGTSRLVRTGNGVNYNVSTSDLEPGHAYTLWIVIFNVPDECAFGRRGPNTCASVQVALHSP